MTELRLPPPQPATPPPSVRLVAAQEPRDVLTQTGGGETAPTDAAAPADAELVATVHQLQQENAELQAYLDRVLEALATSAAESDLTHVIDDPLAPTQYQRAPKDARQAEALLNEALPTDAPRADPATSLDAMPAPVRMRWAANGPNGADPVPSAQLRRRATDRIEARIEAAQQTLGELIYLLDREMRVRDDFEDDA